MLQPALCLHLYRHGFAGKWTGSSSVVLMLKLRMQERQGGRYCRAGMPNVLISNPGLPSQTVIEEVQGTEKHSAETLISYAAKSVSKSVPDTQKTMHVPKQRSSDVSSWSWPVRELIQDLGLPLTYPALPHPLNWARSDPALCCHLGVLPLLPQAHAVAAWRVPQCPLPVQALHYPPLASSPRQQGLPCVRLSQAGAPWGTARRDSSVAGVQQMRSW